MRKCLHIFWSSLLIYGITLSILAQFLELGYSDWFRLTIKRILSVWSLNDFFSQTTEPNASKPYSEMPLMFGGKIGKQEINIPAINCPSLPTQTYLGLPHLNCH